MYKPTYRLNNPQTEIYIGDCIEILPYFPAESVNLIFADPPFNIGVKYGAYNDRKPRAEYLQWTYQWLDECLRVLAPQGSIWLNLPDDIAAEAVIHLKNRGLTMINWCMWHYRFGQHGDGKFINSKTHVPYSVKDPEKRIWNPEAILELSDRAAKYNDKRTFVKDHHKGQRVPLDVWYGPNWGRIQGNNKERRPSHPNQIPEVYMQRVILACSNKSDLVLDPFLGSGTTSTIARFFNRRSIGIEINPSYAASAFERIQEGPVRRPLSEPRSQP